jgi:hypothetical protein
MLKNASVFLALSFLITLAAGGRADDKDCRAVIEKAIQAVGGEQLLAKNQALTWKEKGTFYGQGGAQPYTGSYEVQWPDQFRMEIQGVFTLVLNDDKGWFSEGGKTQAMNREQLAQQKETQYASWVTTLLPLKNKAFTLSPLGESKVGERAAVGVNVAHQGHKDIQLFFDKQRGLLLKTVYRYKEARIGKEMEMVITGTDFKEFGGLKFPTKVAMKRDGKKFVEAEMFDIKPVQKLDASVFGRP